METADHTTLDGAMDALLRLHSARWRQRGERGVVAEERLERFHREVARRALHRRALRLYTLHLDGTAIAVLYGFLEKGRAWYYLSGFEPSFAKASPGTLVFGHAIEAAIAEGARELDFLRGREPYKYRWGAEDRLNHRRRFSRTAPAEGP